MKYFCITHRESKAREVDLPAPDLITNEWQNQDQKSELSSFLLHPWSDNQEKTMSLDLP